MTLLKLLRSRRSVRAFRGQAVEPEKVELLLEAALRAPSSKGKEPCRLVVVNERSTIARLAAAKPHGATFLADAPLVIVVAADPQVSDVWVEDASIVATVLHLQAHDLGLGSCWVQLRRREHDAHTTAEEYVAGVLGLSPQLRVLAMVAVGYAAETAEGRPGSTLSYDHVSVGCYGARHTRSDGGEERA